MEGNKKYRAKIDKKVKSLQKFFEGDKVQIKGNAKIVGTVMAICSQTPITNINATTLLYGVRPDDEIWNTTLYYTKEQLTKIDIREKVSFT